MKLLFSFVVLFFLSLSNTTQALFLPNMPNKPNMDEFTLNMYDLFNLMNNMDDLNDDLNTGQFVLQADGESIYRFNLNMDKFDWQAFTNEENIQEHIENIKKYIDSRHRMLNRMPNDLASDVNDLDAIYIDTEKIVLQSWVIRFANELSLRQIEKELEYCRTNIKTGSRYKTNIKTDLSPEMIQLAEETIVRYSLAYDNIDNVDKQSRSIQRMAPHIVQIVEKIYKNWVENWGKNQFEKMNSTEQYYYNFFRNQYFNSLTQ